MTFEMRKAQKVAYKFNETRRTIRVCKTKQVYIPFEWCLKSTFSCFLLIFYKVKSFHGSTMNCSSYSTCFLFSFNGRQLIFKYISDWVFCVRHQVIQVLCKTKERLKIDGATLVELAVIRRDVARMCPHGTTPVKDVYHDCCGNVAASEFTVVLNKSTSLSSSCVNSSIVNNGLM